MKNRLGTFLLGLTLGALIMWIIIMYVKPAPPPAGKTMGAMDRPECPHDPGDTALHGAYQQVVDFVGAQASVPEFHDCQKFLVPGPNGDDEFHALEAIYVPDLDSAYGISDAGRRTMKLKSRLTSDRGMPVAIVYSEEPYDPLGITAKFSCLVLQSTGSTTYVAWMIPLGPTDECQTQTHPAPGPTGTNVKLAVRVIPPKAYKGILDVVPPVARWDWDAAAHKHYIGMKCGTSWCEVHWNTGPFTSSAEYSTNATSQVFRVKGWYDEQFLALPPNSNGTTLKDGAMGTVFPVPELGTRTHVTDYPDGQWKRVAWVSLDRDSPKYKSKYGFDKAPPGQAATADGRRNEVSFCYQTTANSCGAILANPTACPVDPVNGGTWFARIQSATSTPQRPLLKYFCVQYRPNPANHQPPGVVRWRWKVKDETIWVSCPSGCCEVDPELT